MIRAAKESKVSLHISHLKALGSANWGKAREALSKIEEINKEELEINFGQYLYDAACTGLKVVVPAWIYEGGEKAFRERLNDKDEYEKILSGVNNDIKKIDGAKKILIAIVRTKENS